MPNSPAKVTFLLPDFNGGGAERALLGILSHWPEAWEPPQVIVRVQSGPFHRAFLDTGARIDCLQSPDRTPTGLRSAAQHVLRTRRLLRQNATQVVVSMLTPVWGALAAMGNRRLRLVTSVQNPIGRTVSGPKRSLAGFALRLADVVVPIAPGIAREVEDLGVNSNRVTLIPNSVDLERFTFVGAASPSKASPTIVAVGRLHRQKRLDIALRAFAHAQLERDVSFGIAGTGPLRQDLESLAHRLGVQDRVEFLGYISDIESVLAGARCLLMTSDYEGFGNVLIEALAAGVPVVSTDAPYGPRYILRNGEFGILCPRQDIECLASATEMVLQAPLTNEERRRLRARAADFDVRAISRQWLSLLSEQAAIARQTISRR